MEGDCILWGCRVVIPEKLQQKVLEELHRGHPGIVRMKTLARGHAWWPGLDRALEDHARDCAACQASKNSPARAPLHSWAWPSMPWERTHVDYAGPIQGKMLLIAVDAHTKWPEVCVMNSSTSSKTITVLRDLFARYGLPREVVSDNGPQFSSDEFGHFLTTNGVKHRPISPYHPASNGAAERVVQTVKRALQAGLRAGGSLEQSLSAFLLQYRTTPHATTGVAPCTLKFGRDLRTRLHLLAPDIGGHVRDQLARKKERHDQHCQMRTLGIGQSVWARNFRDGARWVKAMVSDRLGPVSYLVQLRNGDFWRRHIDHLRRGSEQPPKDDSAAEEEFIVLPESQTEGGGPPAADTETPPGGISSQVSPEAPSQTSGPEMHLILKRILLVPLRLICIPLVPANRPTDCMEHCHSRGVG